MSEQPTAHHGPGAGDGAERDGLYIKQVASMLGVSASILRAWEKERLITPERSASGYRMYRAADVDRLRRIRDLFHNDGLNPAGVRRLLAGDAADVVVSDAAKPSPVLRDRLQHMRKRHGMTLRELAAATGLSASALSAVERGVSTPSVRTLRRLADAFETTVPVLLGTAPSADRVLVHPCERQEIDLGIPGVRYESMFSENTSLQSMMIYVQPGAGSPEAYAHEGEEFLYLLDGSLELTLEEVQVFRLQAGDAMNFASTRPHRWLNPGETRTQMLWVNTPPSF